LTPALSFLTICHMLLCTVQAFYSPRAAGQQRKGGCRSLQAELATTKRAELMWRRCSQEVSLMVDSGVGDNGRPLRLHLRGPAGCGKSIVLAQTVERARSCGWCDSSSSNNTCT
jgi:hypothetical protein